MRGRFNRPAAATRLLHRFADENDLQTLVALLQDGADAYATGTNGETALHAAARAGNTDMLHVLTAYDRSGINLAADTGTALGIAAATNNAAAIHRLADAGADLDAPDKAGLTPLMRAWQAGAQDAMHVLLRLGANVGTVSADHKNILHMAAAANDAAAISILIENGGMQHLQDRTPCADKLTPLHTAVREGAEKAARALIAAGADVHTPDAQGMTPLHAAAARGDADMIYTLVCEGHADVHCAGNADGYSALHIAVINKQYAALRALCALGGDPHQMDGSCRTPLNIAGWNGFLAGVQYLMEEVPAETAADAALQSRTQALYDALFYEHTDAAAYLIASGKVDMNRATYCGEYVLHAALQSGKPDMAERIIAAGADVNVRNTRGVSPLLLSVTGNLAMPTALLLQKGANPNLGSPNTPPLHAAVEGNYPFMLMLLLEHGADPRQVDSLGREAIDLARQNGRTNMVYDLQQALRRRNDLKKEGPAAPHP